MAPKPIFIQTRGETGLETLIDANQIPQTPHFPNAAESWDDLNAQVDLLLTNDHGYKTVVIDTLNGAEALCHEHTCQRDYGGDMISHERGFMAFHKGYTVALQYWRELLTKLDRLRIEKRMSIILLSHGAVVTYKNPEGSDYGRYAGKLHDKTWAVSKEWADVVLFGSYKTATLGKHGKEETDPTKRAKAVGGTERILLSERSAAYDAKNRLGLPPEIECGENAAETWKAFTEAAKAARENGVPNA
jgi:hypothetical protein